MKRLFTVVTLLIVLTGNSVSLMRACGNPLPALTAAVTTETEDADTPDCCKDGLCPAHQQRPKAESPDCNICGMSSAPQAALVATVQTPAVLTSSVIMFRTDVQGSVPSLLPIQTFNPELPILTPPPRA